MYVEFCEAMTPSKACIDWEESLYVEEDQTSFKVVCKFSSEIKVVWKFKPTVHKQFMSRTPQTFFNQALLNYGKKVMGGGGGGGGGQNEIRASHTPPPPPPHHFFSGPPLTGYNASVQ